MQKAYLIQITIIKCSIECEKYYNINYTTDTDLDILDFVKKYLLKKLGRVRFIEYEINLISITNYINKKWRMKNEIS